MLDIYGQWSIVFIVLFIVFTVAVGATLIYARVQSQAEFRNKIKTYKYGKFMWVFILALPLFVMSYHYSGLDGWSCFFRAFTSASKLMVMQFDFSLDLTAVNNLYRVAVIICYLIAILNLVLFIFSCLEQYIWEFTGRILFSLKRNTKCLIVGNNESSKLLYNNIQKDKYGKIRKVIIDTLDKDEKWKLFTENYIYKHGKDMQTIQKKISKIIDKHNWRYEKFNQYCIDHKDEKNIFKRLKCFVCKILSIKKLQIFVNFANDSKNIDFCCFLGTILNSKDNKNTKILNLLDVYVFVNKQYSDIYSSYIKNTGGCLHLVDEAQIVSTDFISKYPVALYLNDKDKQIDYKTGLVDKDLDISVSFIGFGNTSQNIFLSLFTHSQFVHKNDDGKIELHPVNFYSFDKQNHLNSKFLNNCFFKYYRFKENCEEKNTVDNYYPFPQLNIFNKSLPIDINSNDFHKKFIDAIKNKKAKDVKIIVVSLGTDYETLDVSNKLWKMIVGENIQNCHLFIRIMDKQTYFNTFKSYKDNDDSAPHNSTRNVFGCLEDIYEYEKIIMDDINKLAIIQDALYTGAKTINTELGNNPDSIVESKRGDWSNKDEYNRQSSLSAAIGLRSKLLTLGFDYSCDKNATPVFESSEAYRKYIHKGEDPKLNNDLIKIYQQESLWCILGILEHNRWNAFMVSYGCIPYSKSECVAKAHKTKVIDFATKEMDYKLANVCITTADGLDQLYKDLVEKGKAFLGDKWLNKYESKCDKKQYDYQLVDVTYDILNILGYKIVKKEI